MVEQKAHRGRLWKMLGKDEFIQGMWEYFSLERATATQFLKDAEKEKWEGIQGEWQQESLANEFLDQAKSIANTDRTPKMMRFGYYAFKDRDWEEYKRTFKVGKRDGMGLRKNTRSL